METKYYLKKNWWMYSILLTYIILVGITIYNHEPWADEAQSWLMARDTGLFGMLFKHIRYIGHPGLWYSILMIFAKLNLPYFSMNIVSGIIAAMGVYVFLRYSPFPKIIKALLPFSYYIFYQYAVIARGYVLLPLLLFLIAKIYQTKTNKIYLFTFLVCLLANVSAHGFIITISLFLLHLINLFKEWPYLNKGLRIKQIKSGIIFITVIGLIIVQMWPPPDITWVKNYSFNIPGFFKLTQEVLNNSFTGIRYLSLFIFLISLFWFWQKKILSLYLIPAIALFSFFSAVIYKGWHGGIVFLIWIFVMWIGFEKRKGKENIPKNALSKATKTVVTLSLIVVLSFHMLWSQKAAINDLNGSYSAGKSVADYIKTNGLENKKLYVVRYWPISVLPYFDRIIFSNYTNPQKIGRHLWLKSGEIQGDYKTILRDQPDLIIVGRPRGNFRKMPGYQSVGIFKGNLYWKTGIYETNHFALFRKE